MGTRATISVIGAHYTRKGLPIQIFFIAQSNEQISSNFFEELFMLLIERGAPIANFAAAESGRALRVYSCSNFLQSCLPVAGELEAALYSMVKDARQAGVPLMHEILIMQCQHLRLLQPSHERLKALAYARQGSVQRGSIFWQVILYQSTLKAQDAGPQALVKGLQHIMIVIMVNVIRRHFCHIMHMRNHHVPRVAQNELDCPTLLTKQGKSARRGMYMTVGDVSWQ